MIVALTTSVNYYFTGTVYHRKGTNPFAACLYNRKNVYSTGHEPSKQLIGHLVGPSIWQSLMQRPSLTKLIQVPNS
jgi:hypothetical protein